MCLNYQDPSSREQTGSLTLQEYQYRSETTIFNLLSYLQEHPAEYYPRKLLTLRDGRCSSGRSRRALVIQCNSLSPDNVHARSVSTGKKNNNVLYL